MVTRNSILFLVALGCAWAIGLFMGSTGTSNSPLAPAASDAKLSEAAAAHQASTAINSALSEAGSKSVYTLSERLRSISANPSFRWRSAQLARLADDTSASDFPGVLDEVKKLVGQDSYEATRVLFARWAQLDPRAAMEFAIRTKNSIGSTSAIAEWAAADPVGAVGWLKALPMPSDRVYLVPGIVPALARVDPAQAFQLLQENPNSQNGDYYYRELVARWAIKDLSAARSAVDGMSPGHIRNGAMGSLAQGWAKTDPDAALAWALELPNRQVRVSVIDAAVRGIDDLNFDAMAARAKALPDERDRSALLASLVGATASRDPEKGLAMLGEISSPELRETATSSVISALVSTDVSRAATLAENFRSPHVSSILPQIVERLKFVDPERAATLSLKAPENSNNPIAGVLTTWMRDSPEAALGWIEKNKLPSNTGYYARNGLAEWAAQNVSAATSVVKNGSGSENLNWVVNAALQGIALRDPEGAAEMAGGTIARVVDGQALGAIARNWAEKDLKGAAQWVTRLPDTPHLSGAAWGVVNTWASSEPTAAAAWIDGLAPGTLRDSATAAFASTTARTDPETALDWASTIQKEGSRDSAMGDVVRTWAQRDPEAVKAWAAKQPNLPQGVRSYVPQ